MRARRGPFAIAIATAVMAAFAACGFPDVTFVDELGSPEAGAEGGGDAAPARDTTGDAADVVVIEDAGSKIDATACTSCDCDEDGYERAGCDGGGKKHDCDDVDPRAHPGQKDFLAAPAAEPTNGDWNCDERVEFAYAADFKLESCAGLLACTGEGFVGKPQCGELGDFYRCAAASALSPCAARFVERRKQGCR